MQILSDFLNDYNTEGKIFQQDNVTTNHHIVNDLRYFKEYTPYENEQKMISIDGGSAKGIGTVE